MADDQDAKPYEDRARELLRLREGRWPRLNDDVEWLVKATKLGEAARAWQQVKKDAGDDGVFDGHDTVRPQYKAEWDELEEAWREVVEHRPPAEDG